MNNHDGKMGQLTGTESNRIHLNFQVTSSKSGISFY